MPLSTLEVRGLTKTFGGAPALQEVSLAFRPGEIHALVGENGAGKSTLIGCCAGLLTPDAGTLLWRGEKLVLRGLPEARERGIRLVHQEADFFPNLSLAENLMHREGAVPGHRWRLDRSEMRRRAAGHLRALDARFAADAPADRLSVAQRMTAEMAAALSTPAPLLFLDEPTASLSAADAERLFRLLKARTADGAAIVYVSHRLEEVLEIADRVTVLRDGRVTDEGPIAAFDQRRLVWSMAGRQVEPAGARESHRRTEPGLTLERFSDASGRFRDVSLAVAAGEIVALYGLVGAGRSELAEAIVGLRPSTGRIGVRGNRVRPANPGLALDAGIAWIPEDRRSDGLFLGHPCRENVSAGRLARWARAGFFSVRRERRETERLCSALTVRCRSLEQPVGTLSGGNQQKVMLARALVCDPKVLIVDEPTRGVDVAAKADIHAELRRAAAGGAAVLAITSDLAEAVELGDRLAVMRSGRIARCFDRGTAGGPEILHEALPGEGVPAAPPAEAAASRLARRSEYTALAAAAGLATLLAALCGTRFASLQNARDVLAAASLVSIAAAGSAQVLIAGGIDISIGSMMGLCAAVCGSLALHAPALAAVAAAIALGAALGGANALIARWGRIHSIIVTLAGIYIFRGAMLRFTGGYEVAGFSPAFRRIGEGAFGPVPKVVAIAAAVHAANAWFLGRTLPGRRIYAVGGSERAAALAGLRPWRSRTLAFVIGGGLTGLTAMLWAAYYGKVQSNTGAGLELQAIAAAVIGGCSPNGGRGQAWGVAAGAVLIAMIYNGLILLRVSSAWEGVFVGGLILAASASDRWLPRFAREAAP